MRGQRSIARCLAVDFRPTAPTLFWRTIVADTRGSVTAEANAGSRSATWPRCVTSSRPSADRDETRVVRGEFSRQMRVLCSHGRIICVCYSARIWHEGSRRQNRIRWAHLRLHRLDRAGWPRREGRFAAGRQGNSSDLASVRSPLSAVAESEGVSVRTLLFWRRASSDVLF
jgi:hypothetical protein